MQGIKQILEVVSPAFTCRLKKNVELRIRDSLSVAHRTVFISNIQSSNTCAFTDKKILEPVKEALQRYKKITVCINTPDSQDYGIPKSWSPDCYSSHLSKHFDTNIDTIFISYSLIEGNSDREIYDFHKKSGFWWRSNLNSPLNLDQEVKPLQSDIIFYPKTKAHEECYVIERTSHLEIDDTIQLVRNVKSLNAAFSTFVCDSVHDIDDFTFMKINNKFVPIQVSVVVDPHVSSEVDKFSSALVQDLDRENIMFDFSDHQSIANLFEANDRRGIPFSVIIDDETLNGGVMKIRDRDTHFVEPINHKNVIKWLKLNLGMFKV